MSRANEFAFPALGLEVESSGAMRLPVAHQGLTIREHFAAMAMQGMLANPSSEAWRASSVAKYAVECADALIAELSKEPPPC